MKAPLALIPRLRTGWLPAGAARALPEPRPLSALLGPSVVLLALGLGSGEFVLWPNLVVQYGPKVLWAAAAGLLTQFFINMEIERWTLATGETALAGFCRLSRAVPWVFLACCTVPFMWPGWATGAFQCALYAWGRPEASPVPWTLGGLVGIGAILTLSPRVYQVVERIQVVLIVFVVAALAAMVAPLASREALAACARGLVSVGFVPPGVEWPLFLGALAYAGLGGAGNLVQSHYVQEKGYGMGVHAPKLVSPWTGRLEAAPSPGGPFEDTEEQRRRWRGWWRAANIEQFVSFFLLGLVTIVLLALLAESTLGGRPDAGKDFAFIRLEGEVIGNRLGPAWPPVFYGVGFAVLLTTALGVLDLVGRLVSNLVTVAWKRERAGSQNRTYAAVVWIMIALGAVVLLGGFRQPRGLLLLSGGLNAAVMALYSLLLLYNNWTSFPAGVRPSPLRVGALLWAGVFYGYFTVLTVRSFL